MTTTTLAHNHKHTRDDPCEVCQGWDKMPQHQGIRCWGITYENGTCICTNERYAGYLQQERTGQHHWLGRYCNCGLEHGTAILTPITLQIRSLGPKWGPTPEPGSREAMLEEDPDAWMGLLVLPEDIPTVVEKRDFEIKDIHGQTRGVHHRIDYSDGSKEMPWSRGTSPEKLPLFGSDLIKEWLKGIDNETWYPDVANPSPTRTTDISGSIQSGDQTGRTENRAQRRAKERRIVLVEGETAAIALWNMDIMALATVTGASTTHDPAAFAVLAGLELDIICWPDNDPDGESHMDLNEPLCFDSALAAHVLRLPAQGDEHDDARNYCETHTREEVLALLASAQPVLPAKKPVTIEDFDTRALQDEISEELGPIDWRKSDAINRCGRRWKKYRCPEGDQHLKTHTCGVQICPSCGWRRLEWDWRAKLRDRMKVSSWDFYTATPDNHNLTLSALRKQLTKTKDRARRKGGAVNMVYGLCRLAGMTPTIIMAVPVGQPTLQNENWTVVQAGADLHEAQILEQFQVMYLRELAEAWQTEEELATIEKESHGRHRFQAIGPIFSMSEDTSKGRDTTNNAIGSKQPLKSISGGSGHGAGKPEPLMCPVHNKPMTYVGEVGPEEVGEQVPGTSWYKEKPRKLEWHEDAERRQRTRAYIDTLGRKA